MGIGYLITGCFFLLNPFFSIIDILPDFIGYACILKGLSKLSKLSADFEASYHSFRTLFIIALLRIFTLPLAGGDDQTWLLLMVFCFGLVEVYFTLNAFNALFEGFSYTAQRGESRAVFGKWSETKLITNIFVIARQALCILPELSLLSSTEYGEVTTHGINSLAQFRTIFNILGAVISLAFGIYWYIRIRGYLKGIANDKVYIGMLEDKYRCTVGENKAALCHHALRFSLIMLAVASVLSIELPFDGFNYLPHTVFAALICIAAYHIRNYFTPARKTFVSSLVYTIVSAVVWIYNYIYMQRIFGEWLDVENEGLSYSYAYILESAVQKDFFAIDGLVALIVLTLAEAVCFAILVHHLTNLLNTLLSKYTPKKEETHTKKEDEYYEWERYLPKADEFKPKVSYIRVLCMKVSGYVCALCGPIQVALSFLFPEFWLIALVFRIVWVVLFYLTVAKVKELEETEYAMLGDQVPPHELIH